MLCWRGMDKVSRQDRRAARKREEEIQNILFALLRAHHDPSRPEVREKGLDERDLAFEADLIIPAEMEMAVYATQKRGHILSLLRTMRSRGLVEYAPAPPTGVYRVRLTPYGQEVATHLFRPWWARLRDALRRRRPFAPPSS
ncbi:MAG: hypothetical protein NZ951_07910 [Dehalococcoidia bacterium]|nr:hypothetical protein [Dehalococcoidia bacterium]